MREKRGQKTAIIVGMLKVYHSLFLARINAENFLEQVLVLEALPQRPASPKLVLRSQFLRRMLLPAGDAP